ncbi:PDZK1-interacting protein 1 [Erpetoichthys calabaricus]|uniref:PDZK1-interacting protein 1 n=1 Tax=Erpetoichthys calabaricus TaxID=27687 RepID=UPI00109EF367|nr:PDZK1-interacting protein 1 [Erpetoichthys calabaricus]XP_051788640.1 PDZK1-interacting protein 1 [Erpetoichthys calabaricus]
MKKTVATLLLLLAFFVRTAVAQTDKVSAQRAIPPWLTGIIAVVVFLFLVFIVFIVNKMWCEGTSVEEPAESNQGKPPDGAIQNGTSLEVVLHDMRDEGYDNICLEDDAKVTMTAM